VEAVQAGRALEEAASAHEELAAALARWGGSNR
jgi:hypothetical protein